MSDLISREALLKAHQDLVAFGTDTTFAVRNLINNAPAVSGEVVAYTMENELYGASYNTGLFWPKDCNHIPERASIALYTTPQQPQSVADALEEAIKILDGHIARAETLGQQEEFREAQARIRALIKRNAEGVE